MSAVPLEVILNNSGGEVECYLDPDNEVFFGPVTEREREIRRPLPRKTLHPCEIAEISKRGMTFQEWEDFKDQVQRNELNDKAIKEVYGLDPDTTEESFTSCVTSGEEEPKQPSNKVENLEQSWEQVSITSTDEKSQQEISEVGSLNDTWEIQERMLALAEKLERGEEIPELGITRHSSGVVEYSARNSSSYADDSTKARYSNNQLQTSLSGAYYEKTSEYRKVAVNDAELHDRGKIIGRNSDTLAGTVIKDTSCPQNFSDIHSGTNIQQRKTPSVEDLAKEMDCLFLAQSLNETPVKSATPRRNNHIDHPTPSSVKGPSSSRVILETPIKTPTGLGARHRSTPIHSESSKKTVAAKSFVSKNVLPTSSPVGMYIRSLPEPILIENVRSSQKRQIHNLPMAKPAPVAVKNKDGRWSVVRTPRSSSASKENNPVPTKDFQPVLPSVVHEAAATLIDERPVASPHKTPGTQGKIGKLLERGITSTVMKHQGRIQISKETVNVSKIIQSPMSAKLAQSANSLMEVSVLETVRAPNSYTPNRKPASSRK